MDAIRQLKEEVRNAILLCGKPQGQLARELGVDPSQISHYKNGDTPLPAKRAGTFALATGIEDPESFVSLAMGLG